MPQLYLILIGELQWVNKTAPTQSRKISFQNVLNTIHLDLLLAASSRCKECLSRSTTGLASNVMTLIVILHWTRVTKMGTDMKLSVYDFCSHCKLQAPRADARKKSARCNL